MLFVLILPGLERREISKELRAFHRKTWNLPMKIGKLNWKIWHINLGKSGIYIYRIIMTYIGMNISHYKPSCRAKHSHSDSSVNFPPCHLSLISPKCPL